MEQLLATKFYIPPTRQKLVSRPRLLKRINEGLNRKLTLISAPAGFGKTTLVSEWVEQFQTKNQNQYNISWLSLDDGDNDLARFLTYFIAAFRNSKNIDAAFGDHALSMIQTSQALPTEDILTALINDITAIKEKIIIILDDYHLISQAAIHNALTFLLEYLPPNMHLIITTRVDPQLPIARLRARSLLSELCATELRFTSSEAAEFLNHAMGLNLSAEDISALETRTEGWAAGLQLAAISMQGRQDTSRLITTFTGSHHLVLDYLIEEVLEQQSEHIQDFLLKTAILDRLNGSLCDAVTGQNDGQRTLEHLEHANLFVVSLDNERQWYRYHHLFADLLQQRLKQTQHEEISELHLKASRWYEQNKFGDDAIEHALAAGDFERAGYLIEELAEMLWDRGEHLKLIRWLEMLPEEQLSARPHIGIFHSWILHTTGQQEAAEQRLQLVEQALKSFDDSVSSDEQKQLVQLNPAQLQSRASVIRARLAFRKGDIPNIIKFSREALESLPPNDLTWRGLAAMALGDSYVISGDMNPARNAYSEAVRIGKKAGNTYSILYPSCKLGIILEYLGELSHAQEIYRELMVLVNASGLSQSGMTGLLFALWSEILYHWNDIDNAFQYVSKAVELSKNENDVANLVWIHNSFVKVLFAKRDFTKAKETILKMEKFAAESHVPPWIDSPTAAWKARIWLMEGNLAAAKQWIQERQLNIDNDLLFAHEPENIVFARILFAHGEFDNALNLLDRLIEKAKAGDRITRLIEMFLVRASALAAQGDTNEAVAALGEALSLAEPCGCIRIFIDEGVPMAQLLYEAMNRGISPDYAGRLLNAFPNLEKLQPAFVNTKDPNAEMILPLTKREMEVLNLIAEGLSNKEIADRLFLAMNTVKVHVRNILEKLHVSNRTQAVLKGKALGILPSD